MSLETGVGAGVGAGVGVVDRKLTCMTSTQLLKLQSAALLI